MHNYGEGLERDPSSLRQGKVLDKQSNMRTLGFFWDKEEQDMGKTCEERT